MLDASTLRRIVSKRMPGSAEVHRLSDYLAICQTYDRGVKADLFATALATAAGVFLIDPFAVDAPMLALLTGGADVAGLIATNENHIRATAGLAGSLAAHVYADEAAGIPGAREITKLPGDLDVIGIPGAPRGEIALHDARDGGTVVVGDALINFGSHGFTLLPAKYCSDAKLMRKSLRHLLDWPFERLLFAHGSPILTKARDRLAALLEGTT